MLNFQSADMVSVSWLKTLQGVPASGVATSLPADPASWAEHGFIQVGSVGGSPLPGLAIRVPVLQVDVWANSPNSQQPPWGKAGHLAELVLLSTYDFEPVYISREGFYSARVLQVWPETEPRRITGDPAGFAHWRFDMAMRWVTVR